MHATDSQQSFVYMCHCEQGLGKPTVVRGGGGGGAYIVGICGGHTTCSMMPLSTGPAAA